MFKSQKKASFFFFFFQIENKKTCLFLNAAHTHIRTHKTTKQNAKLPNMTVIKVQVGVWGSDSVHLSPRRLVVVRCLQLKGSVSVLKCISKESHE